jgi:hypothetical protein
VEVVAVVGRGRDRVAQHRPQLAEAHRLGVGKAAVRAQVAHEANQPGGSAHQAPEIDEGVEQSERWRAGEAARGALDEWNRGHGRAV